LAVVAQQDQQMAQTVHSTPQLQQAEAEATPLSVHGLRLVPAALAGAVAELLGAPLERRGKDMRAATMLEARVAVVVVRLRWDHPQAQVARGFHLVLRGLRLLGQRAALAVLEAARVPQTPETVAARGRVLARAVPAWLF
jgi:hypothetical protein